MIFNLKAQKEKHVNYNSNLYNNTMSFQDTSKDALQEEKCQKKKIK